MEKIDLSMKVEDWYDQAYADYGKRISEEAKLKTRAYIRLRSLHMDGQTLRDFCKTPFDEFFFYDMRELNVLTYLLNKCGLHLEMSEEELTEYEGKPAPKADAIDWERRRWELAIEKGKRTDWLPSSVMFYVDSFINEYKKSLNTEE